MSQFRRTYHFHVMPGIPRLLLWSDPSITGDHFAMSRYSAGLSLQFDHLSRVVGLAASHIFLAAAVGVVWGVGVRQCIHSIILGTRNIRAYRAQRKVISGQLPGTDSPAPTHIKALLSRIAATPVNPAILWASICRRASVRWGLALARSSDTLCSGPLFCGPGGRAARGLGPRGHGKRRGTQNCGGGAPWSKRTNATDFASG